MSQQTENTTAGAGPVERPVVALDDWLSRLPPDTSVTPGVIARAVWWCADKPMPVAVEAEPDGALLVSWEGEHDAITVSFEPGGGSYWSARGGLRRHGTGYPQPGAWICLRHNTEAQRAAVGGPTGAQS